MPAAHIKRPRYVLHTSRFRLRRHLGAARGMLGHRWLSGYRKRTARGCAPQPPKSGAGTPRIINADTYQPGLSPHSMRNTGGLTSFQLQGAAIRPHKPGVCGIWRLGVRQTTRACISAVSGIQTRVRKPMVWPHDYIIRIATPRGALGISSLRRSKTLHTAAAIGPSNPNARTWWLRVRSRMRLKLGWEGGPWRRDASADHECCGGAG